MRLLGSLGFLCFGGLPWLSVSISSNLFSVSISEICGLCLLVSFFQGDLFGGLAVGFQYCPFFFFGGRLLGFVVMGGMPGVSYCLVYFFGGLQFHCYVGVGSSLDLVQHGACSSSWSSFPLIIQ